MFMSLISFLKLSSKSDIPQFHFCHNLGLLGWETSDQQMPIFLPRKINLKVASDQSNPDIF
jgi:hypothetical protein